MGVAPYLTPVTGDEVTTDAGHFNIFPVERDAPVPDFHIIDWSALMKSFRATPGVRVSCSIIRATSTTNSSHSPPRITTA